MSLGSQDGVELDHAAGAGPEELREAAVLGDAGEGAVLALHVATGAAVVAKPAGHQGVADHRVPRLRRW